MNNFITAHVSNENLINKENESNPCGKNSLSLLARLKTGFRRKTLANETGERWKLESSNLLNGISQEICLMSKHTFPPVTKSIGENVRNKRRIEGFEAAGVSQVKERWNP